MQPRRLIYRPPNLCHAQIVGAKQQQNSRKRFIQGDQDALSQCRGLGTLAIVVSTLKRRIATLPNVDVPKKTRRGRVFLVGEL